MGEFRDWIELRKEHYRKKDCVGYGNGWIDFDPESMQYVKNGNFKNYDEYLEVQKRSCKKVRRYFAVCYNLRYEASFIGRIDRFSNDGSKVLFKRIMVNGMYRDGIGFDGKEDHVWLDAEDFRKFEPGDCVGFEAEIIRYMRTGNGKQIDFGLVDPQYISKIESYKVPTDEELIDQEIDKLVCETCLFKDHCYMGNCVANPEARKQRFDVLKNFQPGKFTPFTVLLAYEIEYSTITCVAGGLTAKKGDKNYELVKRFNETADKYRVTCCYPTNPMEVFAEMFYTEKPRMYVNDDESDFTDDDDEMK